MRQLLKIKPNFACPEGLASGFTHYAQGIEDSLYMLISKMFEQESWNSQEEFFQKILNNLPIIDWQAAKESGILSLTCLAPAQNTHGLGRFICDHSSRWLLPGKQLALVHVNSLAFTIEKAPTCHLFFHQQLIRIDQPQDFALILDNVELFTKQLKMNILTVMHARNVVMQKTLSFEEKKMIIQENIATLLGKSQKEIDRSAYDHTHQFIIKMISEENAVQFKESLNALIDLRPQIFDRGVFNELQEQISTFSDQFIACRDTKHLTRMISYEYLFRKNTTHMTSKQPNQRHLSFKLLQTQIKNSSSNHPILGILVAMNLLRENEIFEEKHLFKALQACIQNISKIKGSFIEHRSEKNIRTFYLEVEKKDQKSLTAKELGIIKKRLPSEIKTRIESVYSPVFMPKNEEEVLKNILILSNELKYVLDIPQLYVTFQKQTESKLWFTVILLRLIKPNTKQAKLMIESLPKQIRVENLEIRTVGCLRKKYPKEAIVADFCLDKKQFVRKDFSLDLYEARRVLVSSLEETFGELRDYNGGIISKQNEALAKFRNLLTQINIHNDFLIENYFYSLLPTYMPSILPLYVMKKQFQLVLKALEKTYSFKEVFFEIQYLEQYLIILLASTNSAFKDFIMEEVHKENFHSSNLTTLNMPAEEVYLIGYIYKTEQLDEENVLVEKISNSIRKWSIAIDREEFQIQESQNSLEPALIFN
jgi:hypothetical protein